MKAYQMVITMMQTAEFACNFDVSQVERPIAGVQHRIAWQGLKREGHVCLLTIMQTSAGISSVCYNGVSHSVSTLLLVYAPEINTTVS